MDIAAMSMSLNQWKLSEVAALSVMKMTMNSSNENAVRMTEMMEQALDPNLGQNLDLKA
ncbi:YjfB family protein [Clostridium niameyense]|uniref:YjfB family protein n=1 Tax=Clostridium niameyense TaxID=1622073 RepID=UPI0009E61AE8|nr:YjfB family protein [Clostridium niameyense]